MARKTQIQTIKVNRPLRTFLWVLIIIFLLMVFAAWKPKTIQDNVLPNWSVQNIQDTAISVAVIVLGVALLVLGGATSWTGVGIGLAVAGAVLAGVGIYRFMNLGSG